MSSIMVHSGALNSFIELEEYFALKVVYDPSVESTRYVGFYYRDTDLLELSVDRETGKIKKLQIVICNHFDMVDECLQSTGSFEEGRITFHLPQHNECDTFNVLVYRDAIKIILSSRPTQRIIKCGHVLFGLSDDDRLTAVSVINMSSDEINHAVDELKAGTIYE